jgi:hypothetical protein
VPAHSSFDSVEECRGVAATLQNVDVDTWLSAMPDSVIKPNGRAVAVNKMLEDIPVPDSVDVDELKSRGVVSDRYQLGAQVAGAVACGWIDQWVERRPVGVNSANRRPSMPCLRRATGRSCSRWKSREYGRRSYALRRWHGRG